MQETQGRYPGKGNGNPLTILAWRISWMRSLAGYSPWGHKELDTTEWLIYTHKLGMQICVRVWPAGDLRP